MKKTILQGALLVLVFLGTWLVLMQVNWVQIFKVKQITNKTEEKLGSLLWEAVKKTEKENQNPLVVHTVDSLITHICQANKMDREKIKVHILQKDEINAFALPNGHLVLYSGLILNADNPAELSGVICHELAHIELNHVMKKLVKEIGLAVIISMTSGNGGTEAIRKAAKILSSSAFDRGLEKDADIKAVDYLIKARVDPTPFANFLYKLSDTDPGASKYLSWMSTHPDSRERALYIIDYSKSKPQEFRPIMTQHSWKQLQEALKP